MTSRTETPPRRPSVRRWPTAVAAALALVVGGLAALSLLVAFTVYDDPCPGYDDEGSMVAPASPYSRMMCEPVLTVEPVPTEQAAVAAVLLVAAGIGLVSAVLLVVRRPRLASRRRLVIAVAVVLLVQPAVVLLAQYALPRDCLGGRSEAGDCGRDRELR